MSSPLEVSVYRYVLFLMASLLGLLFPSPDTRAAIITEGDARFDHDIIVAEQQDGSLTLTAPTVLEGGGIFIADQPGLVGSVVVDGATYNGGGNVFEIGRRGAGALQIIHGGQVTSNTGADLILAQEFGSSGDVLVSGSGSELDMPGAEARIGHRGLGTFTVEYGARATHREASIGGFSRDSGAGIGTTTVDGGGSRWDIYRDIYVGSSGISGELRIQNGGQVHSGVEDQSGIGIVGYRGAAGLVMVEGPGSLWQHHGGDGISVGNGGTGTLAISSGGKVISRELSVGRLMRQPSTGNGLVTVDGFGSLLSTSGLTVGKQGTGQILLTNGAKLINTNQFNGNTVLGVEQGSYGRLLVDGMGTQWIDSSKTLLVGFNGVGNLEIRNGAVVTNGSVVLGRQSNSRGEVIVDGPGSRWRVGHLSIGQLGSGKVEIANGASLQLTFPSISAEINPDGELVLTDGTILGGASGKAIRNSGTLRGWGVSHAGVNNMPGGRIRVENEQWLVLHESLSNVGGRVDVLGGELEVHKSFINSNGVVALEDATLRFVPQSPGTGELFNSGSMIVAVGANRVYGDILNDDGGSVLLSGNSQTTFYDDVHNFGEINVATGSTATFFGEFVGNGVGGGGTVFLEGDVSPGFSPGTMEFGGNVRLGDFSSLTIEIDGHSATETHDSLQADGEVVLDGELLLQAINPLDDATLTVVSADSVVGTFDQVPELYSHLGSGMFLTDLSYTAQAVTISVEHGFADFNTDGFVDALDLSVWETGYGTHPNATLADGDANGDGAVDGRDLLIWQQKQAAPVLALPAQVVPEPTCFAMMLLAFGFLASGRNRG